MFPAIGTTRGVFDVDRRRLWYPGCPRYCLPELVPDRPDSIMTRSGDSLVLSKRKPCLEMISSVEASSLCEPTKTGLKVPEVSAMSEAWESAPYQHVRKDSRYIVGFGRLKSAGELPPVAWRKSAMAQQTHKRSKIFAVVSFVARLDI